jgi:glutathione synthase/RimK-type ligase-like ATP-grasp enzyme
MVSFKVYPYKMTSQSAKALAQALGVKRLKHEGAIINKTFINWGASKINREVKPLVGIYNHPNAVAIASDKFKTFLCLDQIINIPDYTTDLVEAQEWLMQGSTIVERHTLTGHSGQGIRLVSFDDNELSAEAKLYVRYVKKQHEYRLHVFGDEVFFIQRKARALDVPDDQVNWQVRNHANGFIYANQDVDVDQVAKQMAIRSIQELGLDFGAVDIIYNANQNQYYVLEVNTAPGLFGTTLEKYVEQFKKLG